LFQGSEDLCIRVWDTRQSSLVTQPAMHITGYVYFPLCLDFHADGNLFATGSKGFNSVGCEVKLWDIRKVVAPISEFHGHSQDVTGCKFNNKFDDVLTSCSKDGSIFLWNIKNNDCNKNEKLDDKERNLMYDNAQHSFNSFQTAGKNLTSLFINESSLLTNKKDKVIDLNNTIQLVMSSFDGSLVFLNVLKNNNLNSKKYDFEMKLITNSFENNSLASFENVEDVI
jgi:WD40 repeat protein